MITAHHQEFPVPRANIECRCDGYTITASDGRLQITGGIDSEACAPVTIDIAKVGAFVRTVQMVAVSASDDSTTPDSQREPA